MGGGESPSEERNGFQAVSVAMTNIFEEVPHTSSHLHSHTEAVLYVLEGIGFSEVDYEHYDWEAGDAVHVPPKMTRHEHFNPSDQRTRTLRDRVRHPLLLRAPVAWVRQGRASRDGDRPALTEPRANQSGDDERASHT